MKTKEEIMHQIETLREVRGKAIKRKHFEMANMIVNTISTLKWVVGDLRYEELPDIQECLDRR